MSDQDPNAAREPEDGREDEGGRASGPPGSAPEPSQVGPAAPGGEPASPYLEPGRPGPAYPSGPAGQPYPGQPYPGQPYPGQPYPGQPYPGQLPPGGYPYPLQWGPPQQWGPPAGWGPPAPTWPQVPTRPAQLPGFPHPEPRGYHQMLRTWNYAWWKPVVGVVLVAVGMILVAPLVLMPVLMVGVAIEGGPFWESFEKAATFQAVGPAALLYLNLTLGSLILVCWFVMRVLHRMRPRWLTSVGPKIRWRFFFACVGISVVALVAQLLVAELLPGAQEADLTQQMNDFTTTTAALAIVVLLTTPFQAAGEEYVFRGYLLMAVGSLFSPARSTMGKWVAVVLTAALFAVAHGVQNFPLFFDRFMFGLIAGYLVVRTGGLEAGIAMHILNNFLAFGFALMFSDLTETLNVSEVGWGNIPVTLTQAGTYAVLVLLVARKMGVRRTTNPPVPPSPGPPVEAHPPVPSGQGL